MKRLTGWITWMVAGFYASASSLAFFVIAALLLSQVEVTTEYELAMLEGSLGLSLIPVLIGLAILLISISGTLVSGSRFVNQGLTEGEKSHNPIWGVLLWFAPIYGLYKGFVMGKSIEKATGSETSTTSKLFLGFFVSWLLGVVSEAASRTNLDPQSLFQASILLISLVTATWFYMSVQAQSFLGDCGSFHRLSRVSRNSLWRLIWPVCQPPKARRQNKRWQVSSAPTAAKSEVWVRSFVESAAPLLEVSYCIEAAYRNCGWHQVPSVIWGKLSTNKASADANPVQLHQADFHCY